MQQIFMEMKKMKNKIILFLIAIAAAAAAPHVAHARYCNPTPKPLVLHTGHTGNYVAVWDTFDRNPRIYFSDVYQYNTPNVQFFDVGYVIAEFDAEVNSWLFYGWVGNDLIKRVHRHWRTHRRSFRRCVGYEAHYHYKPYYPHYTYDWFTTSQRYHHRLYRKRYYQNGRGRHLHRYYKPHHSYRKRSPRLHRKTPQNRGSYHKRPQRQGRRPMATSPRRGNNQHKRKPHHKKRKKNKRNHRSR